jgi:hypothetical protein
MQESPGSNRETIETHSLHSHTSVKTSEITCTAYSKKMHTRKNIHSRTYEHHTQRNNTKHEIESQTLLLIQKHLYMGVLKKFSAFSPLLDLE